MKKIELKDIMFASSISVSKIEYLECNEICNHYIDYELTNKLADHITNKKLETVQSDYHIEKRLILMVATPEEFWQLVEEKATEIAMRYKR